MLLKTAPSGMRRRAMSAGAAFSGFVAAFCLGSCLSAAASGPLWGFLAGAVAVAALVRGVMRGSADEVALRLCPRRGVVLGDDRDGEVGAETQFHPIGVTPGLICLAATDGRSAGRSIWRDSLAPDAFRRIAAYALWRRSATQDCVNDSELIARKAVTEGQSAPRTGRPRGQ